MSNRKPNFYSFLVPVVLMSFAPLLGQAATPQASTATASTPSGTLPTGCNPPASVDPNFIAQLKQAPLPRQQMYCKHWAEEAQGETDLAPAEKPAAAAPANGAPAAPAGAPASGTQVASGGSAHPSQDIIDQLRRNAAQNSQQQPQQPAATNDGSGPGLAPTAPANQNSASNNPPALRGPHYLSSDEVNKLFGDGNVQIVTYPLGLKGDGSTDGKPTSGSLAGLVPNSCMDMIQVSTTSNDGTLKASAGTVGFAIYDKGGFGACMQANKNVCDNDVSGTACSSLSKADGGTLHFDSSASAVHVAYLDFGKAQDAALGKSNWVAKDIPGSMNIQSDAAIASQKQAKIDAAQRVLKDQISSCISQGDLPIAEDHLNDILDPSIRSALNDQINKEQLAIDQKEGDKALAAIDKDIDDAATADDQVQASDAVEKKIEDYAQKYTDKGDVAGERVKIVAQNLAGGEDGVSLNNAPSAAMIKDAKNMIKNALSDDNSLNLSDDEQKKLKFFENTELVKREVQASFARTFNLEISAMTQNSQMAQQDPLKAMRAQEQAQNEAKNAAKLQESALKSLESQLKKSKCVDGSGNVSKKVADSDELTNSCSIIAEDIRDVQYASQSFQAQAQTELANIQKQQAQQMQQQIAQQRAAMGLPAQQQSVIPPNMTFGPSLAGGTMGVNGFSGGMPMSIPSYTGGYMATQPTMMTSGFAGYPMTYYSYNPYSYTGVANMGIPSAL